MNTLNREILIEDICSTIDQVLEPLTLSRTLFLILTASFFFILTLAGLALTEKKGVHYTIRTKSLNKLLEKSMVLCIIGSIVFFFLYVFKSMVTSRLPIEYFVGWVFYSLFILLNVMELSKPSREASSGSANTPKVLNTLIVTVWFFMMLGLKGDALGEKYFASEDALDILILAQQGHLFKSTHAPHYDLAPMHTFLYIIISQVLGLEIVPKPNAYSAGLITLSLLASIFLMLSVFTDFIEIHNYRRRLLKLLVPVLLTLHPYALGILSASHVNGLSGVLAILIVMLLVKNIVKGNTPTASLYVLTSLMLITSILMHPQGFVITFFASLFLTASLSLNDKSLKRLLAAVLIFAFILFALKGLYTGALQSLQTFTSYMLEAFFRGFQEFRIHGIEIVPRTYHRVPISANVGYVASLGVLGALTLHTILRQLYIFKRGRDPLLLFMVLSNTLILALAAISLFVVMTGTPTKYVVGTYIPMASLTILIYLAIFLKKYEVRTIGLIIIMLVLILSSLSSLISPLKTPTNYRLLQGSLPAFDYDIDFAVELSNLVERGLTRSYIVIQYAFPTSGPQERNVGQALAVYVSSTKFHIEYGYEKNTFFDHNIVFNYWIYILSYE